ncbi:MAG: MerR family transcriptional regulator, heat shock protein HspR [Candidatus Binatota bacterium]|nr:MerR family transcriptional regulator, heat shock protein HspR [Candidatus Binatota bacterium]
MKYYRIEEAIRLSGLGSAELDTLVREQLIEIKRTLDDEPVISAEDLDKARVASLLIRELDVNVPGAEIILHMRKDMIAMQRQFGKVLEALVDELRRSLEGHEPEDSSET